MKQKNNELEIKVKYLEEEKIKIKDEMKEIKELINQLKLEKEKEPIEDINPIINIKSKIINNSSFHQLYKWINPSKSLNFELFFTTSLNGDKAENFHKNFNGKGPSVIIIKGINGHIFGSYLTVPFSSDNKSHFDDNAFLFSLTKKKFGIKIKEKAVCHYSNWSPYIGYPESCDLAIKEGCPKNKQNYCCPKSYEFNRVDLTGSDDKFFVIEDYEVYLVNEVYNDI